MFLVQCKRSVCSVVKTKSVVANSEINESGLKQIGEGNESANY